MSGWAKISPRRSFAASLLVAQLTAGGRRMKSTKPSAEPASMADEDGAPKDDLVTVRPFFSSLPVRCERGLQWI